MFPWETAVAGCLSTGFVSEAGAGEFAAEIAKAASRLTSDERGVRTVRPLRGRQASKRRTHNSPVPRSCPPVGGERRQRLSTLARSREVAHRQPLAPRSVGVSSSRLTLPYEIESVGRALRL